MTDPQHTLAHAESTAAHFTQAARDERGPADPLPPLPAGNTVKTERIMWLEDRLRGLEREVRVLRWAVIALVVLVAILTGVVLLG